MRLTLEPPVYTRGSYEHVEDYGFAGPVDEDAIYELLRKIECRWHDEAVKRPDFVLLSIEDFRELLPVVGRYACPDDITAHQFRCRGLAFVRSYGVKPGHALVVRLR